MSETTAAPIRPSSGSTARSPSSPVPARGSAGASQRYFTGQARASSPRRDASSGSRSWPAANSNITPVACDVGKVEDVDRLIETVKETHGRLDVLVNNAGTADTADALQQDDDEFGAVLEINLVAPYKLAKRAAKLMLETGTQGSIVNVASIFGLRGSGVIRQTGYAASKGGVVNLTRALAGQWADQGIRVNALAPGWFDTEMTVDLFANEGPLKRATRRTPMGRTGGEDELDGPLLFLASRASSFMTGQTIVIDGGWCAT